MNLLLLYYAMQSAKHAPMCAYTHGYDRAYVFANAPFVHIRVGMIASMCAYTCEYDPAVVCILI
jgi:hypothetical protein